MYVLQSINQSERGFIQRPLSKRSQRRLL